MKMPPLRLVSFPSSLLLLTISSITVRAMISTGDSYRKAPNLPFGDINIVVLTDVHSWVGSHGHQEPYNNADLGDVLSFWEHVKDHCDHHQKNGNLGNSNGSTDEDKQPMDIFFVNNGDFVHGTGLSQMIDGQNDPSALVPLLEKMPYDVVNVGNHELYSQKNIRYMTRPGGYVDWWGDRYLTSNIDSTATTQDEKELGPLGSRYKILHGTNGGTKLLTFGFLYNMRDYAHDAGIVINTVEFVLKQKWFNTALREEHYDGILILAHMDLVDPLVEKIRKAIRNEIGEGVPIVFITGHTHYRGVKQLEDLTMTFEAGRYLDTVGFVSFPRKESVRSEHASSLFQHAFLDTNKKVLFQDVLGFSRISDGETPDGRDLSSFIAHTRHKLDLDKEIGCAPRTYHVNRHVDAPGSLWGLYRDEVVPKVFSGRTAMHTIEEEAIETEDDLPMAMLLAKDAWRYDLYSNSTLVVDDIIAVAPFNDTVVHLGTFSADVILEANKTLNHMRDENDNQVWLSTLPRFILVGNISSNGEHEANSKSGRKRKTRYHLYSHDFGAEVIQKVLQKMNQKVEIRETEFTSTMIWLAFVEQYWSCDGSFDKIPDWFPKYVVNHEGLDKGKLVLAIGILMFLFGLASTVLALSWLGLRKYVLYQPIHVANDDTIRYDSDDDYQDDLCDSKNKGDFEML